MNRRLSTKFEKAMRFAIRCHDGQRRKGSRAPYITHPMAVASLVLEYGGTETQAIAALLHDVIEDCGVTRARLARAYGPVVARIVAECSDFTPADGMLKPPWKSRKLGYIAHLEHASQQALLVSAADKLHNARAIVHDVRHYGPSSWKKFNATPREILWYYESLVAAFRGRRAPQLKVLLRELEKAVTEMRSLIS